MNTALAISRRRFCVLGVWCNLGAHRTQGPTLANKHPKTGVELSPEEVEETKAKMRKFAKADRALDKELDKRRGRRGSGGGGPGCIGGLIRVLLVVGAVGGVGYGIWLWHPWGHESDVVPASEVPGACSEGVNGYVTTTHFTLFGFRLFQEGTSTLCVE